MNSKFMPKFAKYGAFALVVAAAMGGSYYYRGITPVTDASATTNMSSAVYSAPSDAAQKVIALPDFEQIAAKQGPAVVNISVSGTVKTGLSGFQGFPQVDPNDPFYEFFLGI